MKNWIIIILLSALTTNAYCQSEVLIFKVRKPIKKEISDTQIIKKVIYAATDVKPAFPGGESAYLDYIENNLVYPAVEKQKGMQGKVVVSFEIDPMGDITNVAIFRGQTYDMNKEAMRLISTMPKWSPGMLNGSYVFVEMTLTVNFKL